MTFTSPFFLKSLGWGEVEHMHMFVSSSFGHLHDTCKCKCESREYQPLKNADECMLRTTSSMFSVPAAESSGGFTNLFLNHYFRIC